MRWNFLPQIDCIPSSVLSTHRRKTFPKPWTRNIPCDTGRLNGEFRERCFLGQSQGLGMAKLTLTFFGPRGVRRETGERRNLSPGFCCPSSWASQKSAYAHMMSHFGFIFWVSRCLKHMQSIRSETGRWIYRWTVRGAGR